MLEASITLNMPQPNVEPVSAVTMPAISSARDCSRAAALSRMSRRWDGGVADHPGSPPPAASAAARASAREAAATRLTGCPTYEPTLSCVRPSAAARHEPPISRSCCPRSTVVAILTALLLRLACLHQPYARRGGDAPAAVRRHNRRAGRRW